MEIILVEIKLIVSELMNFKRNFVYKLIYSDAIKRWLSMIHFFPLVDKLLEKFSEEFDEKINNLRCPTHEELIFQGIPVSKKELK